MSDRITNQELKKVHEYMETLENKDFVALLHKLLATFNFLVIHGREWKKKAKGYVELEVELKERNIEIEELKRKLEYVKQQAYVNNKDLYEEINCLEAESNRYYENYSNALKKCERLEKQIVEISNRSNTKNKEK